MYLERHVDVIDTSGMQSQDGSRPADGIEGALMNTSARRSALVTYGIAAAAVIGTLLLHFFLSPVVGFDSPFLLLFGAVILAAWYGGFGPGLVATLLASLLIEYFVIEPRFSFTIRDATDQFRPVLFIFEGTLISILSEKRLRSLRTLHAERDRYATTLASIGDGVIATDAHGRLTFMNRVAESLTGWSNAEALNKEIDHVLHLVQAQTRQPLENPLITVLREGGTSDAGEQRALITRDGHEHIVEDSSAPIYDQDNTITGAVLVLRDASERKRNEDQRRVLATAIDLLSTSLDYQQTLRRVALLAVPKLADVCMVDIVGDGNSVSTLAVAYLNERNEPLLAPPPGTGTPLEPDSPSIVQRVLHTGKSELVAELPPLLAETLARHGLREALHVPLAHACAMVVPLLARGRIIGAISFVSRNACRRYDTSDQAVAEQLASRVALAVDNARLYAAAQQSRQRAEESARRTSKLQMITAALAKVLTPRQVGDVVVTQGVESMGAAAGVLVLLPEKKDGALQIVQSTGHDPNVLEYWIHHYEDISTPISDVLKTTRPVFVRSLQDMAARYPQLAAHMLTKHQAFVTLPLVSEDRVNGIMQFNFAAPQRFSPEEQSFMIALADQCSQSLERTRLYEAEQRAHRTAEVAQQRLAFLAEASAVLSSSLNYEQTLANLSRLLVPALADFSTVHMVEEDGSIRQFAVAHPDEEKARLLWELDRRWPLDHTSHVGTPQVIRTGQPDMVPTIDDERLRSFSPTEEQLAMLRQLNMTSSMTVPLISRGRTIGALSLMTNTAQHHFGPADLALAEELARRAAIAVDNARLYEEAQNAIRMRDQFLSLASHELKTPLTSLMGYAELLEKRSRQSGAFGERELRALRVISDQSRRLSKLVSALLDLSRIQRGQLSIERRPFDLHGLVQRLIEEVQPAQEQHVLSCESTDEQLVVLGDELRIEQVLQNLVQNAIKYSPDGGTVCINLQRRGSEAQVSIVDEGIGIPADSIPQLFSRFYRARNVDPQHISGMGIGLYVVKEIVGLHGGTVSVTSEEGKGSTFMITLPLADGERMSEEVENQVTR
jgi:PAS domain S-box-containing protein